MTAPAQTSNLSLTKLSAIHERADALRSVLRSGLLEKGPRLEMRIYTALCDLLDTLNTSSESTADNDGSNSTGSFVAVHHMQDMLTACLLLMDEQRVVDTAVMIGPRLPTRPDTQLNPSESYVSVVERSYCARVFFALCWRAPVPLHIIMQALYPLLDPTSTSGGMDNNTVTMNGIAANALGNFPRKRKLVASTLNGLIVQRVSGVRALLRALLLNDAVPSPHVTEAAGVVVQLLSARSRGEAWILQPPSGANAIELYPAETRGDNGSPAGTVDGEASEESAVTLVALSADDCVRLLAAQHVALFEEHAQEPINEGETASDSPNDARRPLPSFLAKVGTSSARLLPEQTLEERLHLYCALWLNRQVWLPPRDASSSDNSSATAIFRDAYRRLYLTNRWFLTPAFAVLRLRHKPCLEVGGGGAQLKESDVEEQTAALLRRTVAALRRVRTVAHGCELGAAPLALAIVAEVAVPALLSLTAALSSVAREPSDSYVRDIATELTRVWQLLFANEGVAELLGRVLIRCGVTAEVPSAPSTVRGEFCVNVNHVEGVRLGYHGLSRDGSARAAHPNSIWRGLHRLLALPGEGESGSSLESRWWTPPAMPATLKHALFTAALDEAAPLLLLRHIDDTTVTHSNSGSDPYGARIQIESTMPSGGDTGALAASGSALLFVLEAAVLSWPAEALFGFATSLDSVLTRLARAIPLSAVCLRWALGLLPHLLQRDTLRATLGRGTGATGKGDAAQQQQRIRRPSGESARTLHALETLTIALQHVSEQLGEDAAVNGAAVDLPPLLAAAAVAVEEARRELRGEGTDNGEDRNLDESLEWGAAPVSDAAHSLSSLTAEVSAALDVQSGAMLSLALMSLTRAVEEVALSLSQSSFTEAFYSATGQAIRVLFRCLAESGDLCAAGHAVRALTWMGMYRLDSRDTSVLGRMLLDEALLILPPPASGPSSPASHVVCSRVEQQRQQSQTRLKVRVLDVFLSWCDYDTDGRTLRNVDDYCRSPSNQQRLVALFHVFCSLCQPDQASAVQVAALHLIGHYVVAVRPRVSLAQVCGLCRDVFRHTRLAMAKAACASMLARVVAHEVAELDTAVALDRETLEDVEEVKVLAYAMARFQPSQANGGVGTLARCEEGDDANAIHSEVVRQHGRALLELLRTSLTTHGSPVMEL